MQRPVRSPLFPYTSLFRSTDVAASQADVAAHLLERLLAEPDFRARFRRDPAAACRAAGLEDRKSTRLNSSHLGISYAVLCLEKKKHSRRATDDNESRT